MPQLIYDNDNSTRNPRANSAPARKASKIMRQRKKNAPIVRLMRNRKVKTTDQKQSASIMALSRQVKKLQFQSYGDKQYQYQHALLQNTVPNSLPLLTSPIFFAANCFYNNTKIFRGSVDAQGASQYAQAGTAPSLSDFKKQTFDTDLDEQYQWNEQNNQDGVSEIEYLPEYMKYKFRFMGSIRNGDVAKRYRITFFKMKHLPLATDKKNFALPGAAGSYWRLCDDDVTKRNYFSKSYHEIVADRWVTFNPPAENQARLSFNKVVEVPIAFKTKKPLKPELTTDPAGQDFWTNVPQRDIIWCVISATQTSVTNAPTISIQRVLHWRDKHGTYQY